MDEKFIEVKCPECETILIVNRKTGKVEEVRKPILEESTGDRFEDAFKKVKQSKDTLEDRFAQAKAREREKAAKLDALFKENLDKAREKGPIEKPEREFDLD